MLTNIFYQILTDSEHIPPPILHVKAFQIFLFFYLYFPFPLLSLSRKNKTKKPGTAAVPKIAKSKPGHNCRACFFPNFPFPFNLQRSPSAIFLFTSTAFAEHWETQKSRKQGPPLRGSYQEIAATYHTGHQSTWVAGRRCGGCWLDWAFPKVN